MFLKKLNYKEGTEATNNDITEKEMLQVLNKFSTAKFKIMQKGIPKSGNNTFAKYRYHKLEDLQPVVDVAFAENKLMYSPDVSQLDKKIISGLIIDIETGVYLEFPFSFANLTKNDALINSDKMKLHPVQEIGADLTYLLRLLFKAIFSFGEDEIDVDKTTSDTRQQTQANRQADNDLLARRKIWNEIRQVCKDNGLDAYNFVEKEQTRNMTLADFEALQKQVSDYTEKQSADLIKEIERKAKDAGVENLDVWLKNHQLESKNLDELKEILNDLSL